MLRALLAAPALCGLALTGCAQVGGCGYAVSVAPLISVDVSAWVAAHPDTSIRLCADGDCRIGDGVVGVHSGTPTTPSRDGDTVRITLEPVHGSTAVDTFATTVRLTHDRCGQQGAWLRMDGEGRVSATAAG